MAFNLEGLNEAQITAVFVKEGSIFLRTARQTYQSGLLVANFEESDFCAVVERGRIGDGGCCLGLGHTGAIFRDGNKLLNFYVAISTKGLKLGKVIGSTDKQGVVDGDDVTVVAN